MTKRERMKAALKQKKPDRAPILLSTDLSFQTRSIGWDYYDWMYSASDEFLEGLDRLYKRFPFQDGFAPTYYRGIATEKTLVHKEGKRFIINKKTGQQWTIPEYVEPPWRGTGFSDITLENAIPEENPPVIPTLKDIQKEIDHLKNHPPYKREDSRTAGMRQKLGNKVFLFSPGGMPFPSVIFRLGSINRAFLLLADDRVLFKAIMELEIEKVIRNIPLKTRSGADAIWFNAYYEGADLLSPKDWYELCYPYYCLASSECRKAGIFSLVWFLGDCKPLLKWLVEAGIDCIYPEQSRCGYSSNLDEFRKMVGYNIALVGWTGEQETIQNDRDAIERRLKEQFFGAGQKGAFIFGTTHLTDETKPETIEFYCQKAVEIGSK